MCLFLVAIPSPRRGARVQQLNSTNFDYRRNIFVGTLNRTQKSTENLKKLRCSLKILKYEQKNYSSDLKSTATYRNFSVKYDGVDYVPVRNLRFFALHGYSVISEKHFLGYASSVTDTNV